MKKKGLFWKGKVPASLSELLRGDDFVISNEPSDKETLKFCFDGSQKGNISLDKIHWDRINSSPSAFLNIEMLDWDIPKLILKRYFLGEGALNPEENYQGTVKSSSTLKITNDLSFGQAADRVAFLARKNKGNPIQIRNYLVSVLSYFEYLKKSEIAEFPIDLDFGTSNDCFFVQINCHCDSIYIENLLEAINESSVKSPFVSLLSESVSKTDLLEVYTLPSTSKLVFSACWVTNPNYIREQNFSSLLIHQIESFAARTSINGSGSSIPTIMQSELNTSERSYRIAETIPEKLLESKSVRTKINPILVKRLTLFIRRHHGADFLSEDYDLSQLEEDLSAFYDQDAIENILPEEKSEVIRLVVEGFGFEDLEEQTEVVKGKIDPNEYLNRIVKSLDNMSLDEVRIAGAMEDDVSTVVAGTREDLGKEDSTLVKGGAEDKEESVTISGVTENINDELWKVKRTNVAEKVRGKINDLRNSNLSNNEIDEEIKKIVVGELGIRDDEGARLVESLGDDVADDYIRGGLEIANREIKQRIQIEKMEKQLETRSRQVQKMKSVISGMQKELQISRQSSPAINIDESENENFHLLNKDFVESEPVDIEDNEVKLKEIESERINEKLENEVQKLTKENEILLRKFKENLSNPDEGSSNVQALEAENENLRSQIDGLKKRVSFMYENTTSNKEISTSASEVQKIIEDKERYFSEKMKLKSEFDGLKMENRNLEKKVRDLENRPIVSMPSQAQNDINSVSKADFLAKEKEANELKSRLNKLEADRKSHELKAKSFEQKVKFLNAQLEKFQKQESRNKTRRSSGPVDAKVADRLKQMEVVSGRLKMANEKLSKEVAEKKTAIHKANLEAKTLGLKVKDLERKLALLSKKKAA